MAKEASQVLLGVTGMLGRAMRPVLEGRGSVLAPTRAELDVCDAAALSRFLQPGVELVVNCTAYADVDGAEEHEAEATRVNGLAVQRMGERCREIGATLLHFSTDYVFSGHSETPYRVDEAHAPLNAYGRSKAAGERALGESGADFLCVRTSWLYAPWGKNFVRTMASLATQRERIQVVNDQRGRPSSSQLLARHSLALLDAGVRNFAHVTDGGECSWYELAAHVVQRVRPETLVEPCSSVEYLQKAHRPAYSVLDLRETEAVVGPMPAWRDAVDAALEVEFSSAHRT